jgi:hypothetical protein
VCEVEVGFEEDGVRLRLYDDAGMYSLTRIGTAPVKLVCEEAERRRVE